MADTQVPDKDSIQNVFRVVIGVSLVCSIMVATSAVLLREKQVSNQALDLKKNVLVAGGLYHKGMDAEEIDTAFQRIEPIVVDFEKKKIDPNIDPTDLDMFKAAKDPDTSILIPSEIDIANIRRLPRYGIIYLLKKDGRIHKIILPIAGLGLWSTIYGFISLERDGITVSGLNFYDHAETPGLGGEIDNVNWQNRWVGKKVYQADGLPVINVLRGNVDSTRSGSEHQVDGISGATITARAVGAMVRFWLSDDIYGRSLKEILEKDYE